MSEHLASYATIELLSNKHQVLFPENGTQFNIAHYGDEDMFGPDLAIVVAVRAVLDVDPTLERKEAMCAEEMEEIIA